MSGAVRAVAAFLAVSLLSLGACGTTQPTIQPLTLSTASAVESARADYSGAQTGLVWVKRHVRVKVGTAPNPSKAESVVEISALAVNYGTEPAVASLRISAPDTVLERKLSSDKATVKYGGGVIDPAVGEFVVSSPVAAKGHFEIVARYRVLGTLVNDVRRIYETAPTGELLLSYHVPSDAVGSFGLVGAKARPLVTSKDGLQIIAVMMRNLRAEPADKGVKAYARYITRRAKPKGYSQAYASSWKRVLSPYASAFGEASEESRGGASVPPVRPKVAGLDGVKELALWTRDRIQRKDAYVGRVPWAKPRRLPPIIQNNDLYAVDKVHILHWLLEAAGIKHQVAVVRSAAFPPLTSDLPSPGAFDGALIYVPAAQMWLDPACQTCEPGQVAERFRGRQAALLPAQSPALIRVPGL